MKIIGKENPNHLSKEWFDDHSSTEWWEDEEEDSELEFEYLRNPRRRPKKGKKLKPLLTCEDCKNGRHNFDGHSAKKSHYKYHHSNLTFFCRTCARGFATDAELTIHIDARCPRPQI